MGRYYLKRHLFVFIEQYNVFLYTGKDTVLKSDQIIYQRGMY